MLLFVSYVFFKYNINILLALFNSKHLIHLNSYKTFSQKKKNIRKVKKHSLSSLNLIYLYCI